MNQLSPIKFQISNKTLGFQLLLGWESICGPEHGSPAALSGAESCLPRLRCWFAPLTDLTCSNPLSYRWENRGPEGLRCFLGRTLMDCQEQKGSPPHSSGLYESCTTSSVEHSQRRGAHCHGISTLSSFLGWECGFSSVEQNGNTALPTQRLNKGLMLFQEAGSRCDHTSGVWIRIRYSSHEPEACVFRDPGQTVSELPAVHPAP